MQRSGCHYLRVRYEVQTSIVLEHSTQMQGRQTNGSKYIHAALRSVYYMFAIEDAIISLNFAHSPTWHHSHIHSIIANNQVGKYNQIELRGKTDMFTRSFTRHFHTLEIEGVICSPTNHALVHTRTTPNKWRKMQDQMKDKSVRMKWDKGRKQAPKDTAK